MTPSQRRIVLTACLAHGAIHVCELAVPGLLVLIQREYGAGDFALGNVVMAYSLGFGLGALPAGMLVDRLGAKSLLVACLLGAGLSMIGMAVAPSLAVFAVAAVCMGLALSIYHPAGTAMLTHSLTMTGRLYAWHGMAGNLGVASASAIAAGLGALFGWRWAVGAIALMVIGLGFFALRLPVPHAHAIDRKAGHGRWPQFILLLVAAVFMGMVYRGMTTFLPKYFTLTWSDGARAATALGGGLATAALLVGLAGMYLSGRLADRGYRREWIFLVGALVQIPFLLGMALIGGHAAVPLAMGVAFFHFVTQPVANHMVADFTPPRLRGLGFGLYFFFAFGAGSAGATLGGWVSERWGLAQAFTALALVLVPSVVAMILLGRSHQRDATGAMMRPEPAAQP